MLGELSAQYESNGDPACISDGYGVYGSAAWYRGGASAASTTGDWTKTSTNSIDIRPVWDKIITAYDNGDNLIIEFIA